MSTKEKTRPPLREGSGKESNECLSKFHNKINEKKSELNTLQAEELLAPIIGSIANLRYELEVAYPALANDLKRINQHLFGIVDTYDVRHSDIYSSGERQNV